MRLHVHTGMGETMNVINRSCELVCFCRFSEIVSYFIGPLKLLINLSLMSLCRTHSKNFIWDGKKYWLKMEGNDQRLTSRKTMDLAECSRRALKISIKIRTNLSKQCWEYTLTRQY